MCNYCSFIAALLKLNLKYAGKRSKIKLYSNCYAPIKVPFLEKYMYSNTNLGLFVSCQYLDAKHLSWQQSIRLQSNNEQSSIFHSWYLGGVEAPS